MEFSGVSSVWVVAQQPGGGDLLGMLVPLILVMGVFYLLIWRPQAKSMQKHQEFVNGLKVGDEVVTDSGLFGKVVAVETDAVSLEISKGVKIRVRRKNVESFQGQTTVETSAS